MKNFVTLFAFLALTGTASAQTSVAPPNLDRAPHADTAGPIYERFPIPAVVWLGNLTPGHGSLYPAGAAGTNALGGVQPGRINRSTPCVQLAGPGPLSCNFN